MKLIRSLGLVGLLAASCTSNGPTVTSQKKSGEQPRTSLAAPGEIKPGETPVELPRVLKEASVVEKVAGTTYEDVFCIGNGGALILYGSDGQWNEGFRLEEVAEGFDYKTFNPETLVSGTTQWQHIVRPGIAPTDRLYRTTNTREMTAEEVSNLAFIDN